MLLFRFDTARAGLTALIAACSITPSSGMAEDACEISSDIGLYNDRVEQAIMLMQYEGIIVRATDGKIRCEEDRPNTRQICSVDGPGEILIQSDKGLFVVQLNGQDAHELRIHASGDLTCGLASDFR